MKGGVGPWVVVKGWGAVGGGRKGDGVVGGVRGGSAKNGTHHPINIGNSLHIFVASPDNESFKKKNPTPPDASNFCLRFNEALTRIVTRVPSTAHLLSHIFPSIRASDLN